ncbi:MAG TPA: hypothetical protein VGR22_09850, partial [Thermomicrobiales bacterium]|nr:hypothetical protein [Thermomicrobiales bacterium]
EYRVDAAYQTLPFRMKDVFMSAILVAANEALLRLASIADAILEQVEIIESWIERGRLGLAEQWNDERVMCCDRDLVAGRNVTVRTLASLAPVIAGGLTSERRDALLEMWRSEAMVGHPNLRWPLPPSTSPLEPEFSPRTYWRGPVWPVMNWLFAWSLRRSGAPNEPTSLPVPGWRRCAQSASRSMPSRSPGSRSARWTSRGRRLSRSTGSLTASMPDRLRRCGRAIGIWLMAAEKTTWLCDSIGRFARRCGRIETARMLGRLGSLRKAIAAGFPVWHGASALRTHRVGDNGAFWARRCDRAGT